MGMPRKKPKIEIEMSEELKAAVEEAAREEELTAAAWARQLFGREVRRRKSMRSTL